MGVGKTDPSLDYHIGKFISGMRAERVAVKMGYGYWFTFVFVIKTDRKSFKCTWGGMNREGGKIPEKIMKKKSWEHK